MKHLYYHLPTLVLLALVLAAPPVRGQGYINQAKIEDLLERRAPSLDALPEVSYRYHVIEHETGNSVYARAQLYTEIGDGDARLGRARAYLVGLLNRVEMQHLSLGDTVVVPSVFDLDLRAYSPFPHYYDGGSEFDKLFIMDKSIQAFAAYEHGELVRWGIINTGNPDHTPTPNGRFNFNWKEEYRVSSESPDGQPWEMYWVVNFHAAKGMHVHQYEMPTGGPASHGCVRLVNADARWIYHWAEPWQTTVNSTGIASTGGNVLKPGTTVLILGDEPEGKPSPFLWHADQPALKHVELPDQPYDVPPGTSQQEHFDGLRTTTTASL